MDRSSQCLGSLSVSVPAVPSAPGWVVSIRWCEGAPLSGGVVTGGSLYRWTDPASV